MLHLGGARLVIRERELKQSTRASGPCVPLDWFVAIARRRRAFFRTPSSLLASPEEAQQRLREAQQRKPEAGQRNPERYQRKTLPRIGPFQWVTTIRGKNPLLPASPGAAPRGGAFGDRTTLSVVSDNRKKKVALLSRWLLWGRNRERGGGGGRRHQGVMAGLVPAIPEGPAHLRRQARKALRPSAFLPVAPRRDSFLRRPGVDGRDKPGHDGKGSTNEQQTGRPTDNAIRAKSRRAGRRLDRPRPLSPRP